MVFRTRVLASPQFVGLSCIYYIISYHIWRFPQRAVPPNHPFLTYFIGVSINHPDPDSTVPRLGVGPKHDAIEHLFPIVPLCEASERSKPSSWCFSCSPTNSSNWDYFMIYITNYSYRSYFILFITVCWAITVGTVAT